MFLLEWYMNGMFKRWLVYICSRPLFMMMIQMLVIKRGGFTESNCLARWEDSVEFGGKSKRGTEGEMLR